MHVVLLNQPFHPDVVATAQMGKDLGDELVRRGHSVTAVCSRSIYGQKGATLPPRETIDGIDIRRTGFSLFGKAGIVARIADFALFYALASTRVLTMRKPDVVVGFTTPPFIAMTGIAARWLRGSRAVYWVMDLYPDVPVACGVMKPRGVLTRVLETVHRFLLRRSDANVVLGRCMRDLVVAKGVAPSKVKLIPVWADLTGIDGAARETSPFRQTWNLGDAFTVMYSGNYGLGHDARTLCDAMLALKDRADIRFVFVGGGKRRAEVEAFIGQHQLANASWHEYVPREQLGQSLAAADVHLISVKEGCEGTMVPSKVFGIMAAARPGVFVGHPSSEVARLLSEHDCGSVIREGDSAGLVATLLRLKDDASERQRLGENARNAVRGRYDRETATKMWADLLESLVANKAQARQAAARGAGAGAS